ncbi:hypothetical protein HO133_005689 [Letharia lupina]|uniref:BTB domain-containing protein n=1 Tax=Letharia lupina TaxID=560253 RepID=A0A8H6C7E7_9LECA|nr:uncharacterized protein HO133_005689 [Letharia lupina]KAF6218342.1 hypothetical protein HO133_005689 [Letharia lupina]
MSSSGPRLVSGAAHSGSLFNNDQFSDLKIKCEDQQIPAHKVVESEGNLIDLSHDTKPVVYRMLEFLYHGEYREIGHLDYLTIDKDLLEKGRAQHALLHAEMFAVADKYDIATLGVVAMNKFEKALSKKKFGNGHYLDIIKHVYSTTPESNRGLRDLVVSHARAHGNEIQKDSILNPRLEEIVSITPQFAWDLIQTCLLHTPLNRCSACKAELRDNVRCSGCIKKGRSQQ